MKYKKTFLLLFFLINNTYCTLQEDLNHFQNFGLIIPHVLKKYERLGVMNNFLRTIQHKFFEIEENTKELNWKHLYDQGLSIKELDFLAYEFCKLKTNAHVTIIWPKATKHIGYITNIINKYGAAIYTRQVMLKGNALRYLLQTIPEKAKAVDVYLNYYFDNKPSGNLTIILCTFPNVETSKICKKEIRNHLKLIPPISALHICDNQSQSIDVAQIFFNENTIKYINSGLSATKFGKFNFLLQKYRNLLNNFNFDNDYCCVDGSSILAMHGIRDINIDFDFLCYFQNLKLPEIRWQFNDIQIGPMDLHNNAWIRAGVNPIETIFNPNHYFYYQGIKFTTLERIRLFKFHQNRELDQKDIQKIDPILNMFNTFS